MAGRVILKPNGPYDFALSVRAALRYLPDRTEPSEIFRQAVRLGDRPAVMEVRGRGRRPRVLEASFHPAAPPSVMRATAEWILHADLDLRPFYRLVRRHPVLGPMVKRLHGLVPMRTPSLFVMAVTAITEQQISLTAAYRIRERLIERYGVKVGGVWAFPTPQALAGASIRDLKRLGLSARKAEYITGIARGIARGSLDLDRIKTMGTEEAREYCMSIRGIGPWAADYMLLRGLGRQDAFPADDLGLQKLIGRYFGDGVRLTARQARERMEPFAPYRGLAAFYMMVQYRLFDLKRPDAIGQDHSEKLL